MEWDMKIYNKISIFKFLVTASNLSTYNYIVSLSTLRLKTFDWTWIRPDNYCNTISCSFLCHHANE